ncbi:trypsin-7-like [Uranotaenia lowii]|uniref:trypsin-7-like n=1 Tax=Uranotaenia lowii TaxID=190385 RepID=UPI0024784130|nr:trypsin-7-like [Uranotaenia lowii]
MMFRAVLAIGLAAIAVQADSDFETWQKVNSLMPRGLESMPETPGTGFIVGGLDASIADFPYMLSLRLNGSHMCGASVISEEWVLTAAHCTFAFLNREELTLQGGTHNRSDGGVIFTIAEVVEHPLWDLNTITFDVAVIRTVEPLVGHYYIRPVALDPVGTEHPAGSRAVISGWGRTTVEYFEIPEILQKLSKPIIDQELCDYLWGGFVQDDMLCAGLELGHDACNMDSGGPMVVNGVQIGVVSWGNSQCAGNYPGVYARVAFPGIRNWITEVTGI